MGIIMSIYGYNKLQHVGPNPMPGIFKRRGQFEHRPTQR